MEEADKGWLMIRIDLSGCMFLLVQTHLGSPRQRPKNGCCCTYLLIYYTMLSNATKWSSVHFCYIIKSEEMQREMQIMEGQKYKLRQQKYSD